MDETMQTSEPVEQEDLFDQVEKRLVTKCQFLVDPKFIRHYRLYVEKHRTRSAIHCHRVSTWLLNQFIHIDKIVEILLSAGFNGVPIRHIDYKNSSFLSFTDPDFHTVFWNTFSARGWHIFINRNITDGTKIILREGRYALGEQDDRCDYRVLGPASAIYHDMIATKPASF